MYRYYFFDLDGTLTDPGTGITNSVMYALGKFGIHVSDRSELYAFIGPPLKDSFMKYYGFSGEQAIEAVAYYREYFRETGIWENEVYEQIPGVLAALKERQKTIVLATSKPEEFAVEILKHFGLYKYFDFTGAATMDGTRSEKKDVISYAVSSLNITRREEIVMIGDREQDIYGAGANGIDSAGVLYGYGSYDELAVAGATYMIGQPPDIMKLAAYVVPHIN